MNTNTLSQNQLGFIILSSRLFSLLTFSPTSTTVSGSTSLWAIPVASILLWIVTLGILSLMEKRGYSSPITLLEHLPTPIALAYKVLLLLFIFYIIGTTGAEFNAFLETTVFAQSSTILYTLLFLFCCGLVAYTNGIGGLSSFTLLFLTITTFMIIFSVTAHINLGEILPIESSNNFFSVIFNWCLSFGELVLLLLLGNKTIKEGKRASTIGILGAGLFYTIYTFLTLTVLGDFSYNTTYPLYTLSRYAGFGFIHRMDLFHIGLWVFVAVIRGSSFLYSGKVLFSPKLQQYGMGFLFLFSSILCLLFSLNYPLCLQVKSQLSAPLILLLAVIPLLYFAPKGGKNH